MRRKNTIRVVEAHTYGKSRAAEVLADLLRNNQQECWRVGKKWAAFTHLMNSVRKSNMNASTKRHFYDLLYGRFKKLDSNVEKINSYYANVCHIYHSQCLNPIRHA